MDTLKVVQQGSTYLGVYHDCRERCQVRLATSTDMRRWQFRVILDGGASQPYLARDLDGGLVLAVETEPDNHLRLSHFPSTSALLRAAPDRSFDAPRSLSPCAEGTPSIVSVDAKRILMRFHYFAGCQTDRQALGTLTQWSRWSASPDTAADDALVASGSDGKHGDRDDVMVSGSRVSLYEGQPQDTGMGAWRLWAWDRVSSTAVPVLVTTPGGSLAFANPAVSTVMRPDGTRALLVSVFLPMEGVRGGDVAGQLVYAVPAA